MLARMILYGNLRPLQVMVCDQTKGLSLKKEANEAEILAAKQMRLGKPAMDFLDLCIVKLNCSKLQEDFMEGLNVDESFTADIEMTPQVPVAKDPYSQMYLGTPASATKLPMDYASTAYTSGYTQPSGYAG